MGVIKLLDEQVSQLIAAGEVVERPSSVVKELVENAIDAKASKVTIEIRHGGVTMIRVSDNGSGIAPEDVPMMFCAMPPARCAVGRIWAALRRWAFAAKRWHPSTQCPALRC